MKMSKLKNFLWPKSPSKWDLFGVNFLFRVDKKSKHKSNVGGISTVFFVIIALGIICNNALDFFNEKETLISALNKDSKNLHINEINFPFLLI